MILAKVLGTTVDELLSQAHETDVVIRPHRDTVGGVTYWLLAHSDAPAGRNVAKMRIPEYNPLPEPRVHPGRDWFYVLSGTLHLRLGDRDVLVRTGQAASFETMTPHSMSGSDGDVEILSILDHHGERAHLHD